MSWMKNHKTKTHWRALGLAPFLAWMEERKYWRNADRLMTRLEAME